MNKDKQIEEMAKDIKVIRESYFGQADYLFAMKLYEKGYRKTSDIAREIFEEIEAIKCVGLLPPTWIKQFAELKKKYTEEQSNG